MNITSNVGWLALGLLAPQPQLGQGSAEAMCNQGDMIGCMAASWLPRTLAVIILHDCPTSKKVRGVHHTPYHKETPAWGNGYLITRRCYKSAADTTKKTKEKAVSGLTWERGASLLLAMHELLPDKRYYVKLYHATVVNVPKLLSAILSLPSRLPPKHAFGLSKGKYAYHFATCPAYGQDNDTGAPCGLNKAREPTIMGLSWKAACDSCVSPWECHGRPPHPTCLPYAPYMPHPSCTCTTRTPTSTL
jgi:hypothetical protein